MGHARSMLDSAQAWSPASNTAGEYLQFELPSAVYLTGLTTQGRDNYDQWVTSYQVSYSTSGDQYEYVDEGDYFSANSDRSTKVTHTFQNPIFAKYVRIIVKAWSGHISMRAGLVTCPAPPVNYRRNYGFCRGATWYEGYFTDDRMECKEDCSDASQCTAYEYNPKTGSCELFEDEITSIALDRDNTGTTCVVKAGSGRGGSGDLPSCTCQRSWTLWWEIDLFEMEGCPKKCERWSTGWGKNKKDAFCPATERCIAPSGDVVEKDEYFGCEEGQVLPYPDYVADETPTNRDSYCEDDDRFIELIG